MKLVEQMWSSSYSTAPLSDLRLFENSNRLSASKLTLDLFSRVMEVSRGQSFCWGYGSETVCRALTSPGDALDLHLTTSDFTRLNRTLTGQYIIIFSGEYASIQKMEKQLFWSDHLCMILVTKFGFEQCLFFAVLMSVMHAVLNNNQLIFKSHLNLDSIEQKKSSLF